MAGMTCIALNGVLQMAFHPSSDFSTGLFDGIRGALVGCALALIFLGFRVQARNPE